MTEQQPFKWRHFQAEIILLCVRWYLRYSLSYRDLEEIMLERGLHVDHTTIYRWVQQYAPELEKRCHPHFKSTTDSWRVDETYIKVKKQWVYLYRAVDSQGNTLEFLFSPTRDGAAAKRFFLKTLAASHTSEPRVINVDKHAAYPKAFAELQAEGRIPQACELRQVKYLNNLVEQDHRFIKRLRHPRDGLLLVRDGMANITGIRGDEYDQERTTARRGKRRCERPGCIGCQAVCIAFRHRDSRWGRLIETTEVFQAEEEAS
jgi:transposase, IS6 family